MGDYQVRDGLGSSRRARSERGQALIMVTVGIVFLMGILGLVVDVGWGYYRKQVAQAAVDAAVTTAVVNAGSSPACGPTVLCVSSKLCTDAAITAGSNLNSACNYAYADGIAKANVTLSSGVTTPISGVAVQYWVTATASENLLPTFLQVVGFKGGTVAAKATGAVVSSGGGAGGGCLYVLDPSAGQALMISGASVTSTCGIYLNSNASNALSLGGNATISAPAFKMGNPNGISASGSGCKTDSFYTNQNPSNSFQCTDPTSGTATDPLASVPAPSIGSCITGTSTGSSGYSWSNLTPPKTIGPGTYCGGINIGGGNVTFQPGIYVLNGGGLTIQGGSNTTVSGNGVYFYNTTSTGNIAAKSLLVSSQVNMDFKAPTSGAYQGIMFMQDHNVCPSTTHAVNGAPNSNSIKINGSIYIHCTQSGGSYVAQSMLYTGQSTSGYYTALVVDKLNVNGATNLVLDPTGGGNTGIGSATTSKPFLIQ